MGIRIGADEPTTYYIGAEQALKVYVGSSLVWERKSAGSATWYTNGTQPSMFIDDLQRKARAQYDEFLAYTLVTDGMPAGMPAGAKRIKVPDGDPAWYGWPQIGGTVSEGMGYALKLFAWFGISSLPTGIYDPSARANFDACWTYVKHYLNVNGLMSWSIRHDGVVADTGAASDGDFDIAMGLLLAHRVWGSSGTVNYGAEATAMINAIRDNNFTPTTYAGIGGPNVMLNGDGWGADTDRYMPDYFRPAYFREFYQHTGDVRWLDIVDKNYPLAIGYFHTNFTGGVVPNGCKRDGTDNGFESYLAGYNAVRMGFGLVADFLWNGSGANALSSQMTSRAASKAKGLWLAGGAVKAPSYDLNLTTGAAFSNNAGFGLFGPCSLVDQPTFAAEIVNAIEADTELSYYNMGVATVAMAFMAGIAVPAPKVSKATTNPPAGWENYTALDVSAGGQFMLDNAVNYKIVGQTVNTTQLRLRGGGNIVIMGLTRNVGVAGGWGVGEANFGLEIRDEPGVTDGRIVHVEGMRAQSPVDAQGFLLNCSSAHVQLVNNRMFEPTAPLRFKNCDQRDGTNSVARNHPDIIQAHNGFGGRIYGWKSLVIDGMTAYSAYQGFFLKKEPEASLGNVTYRRLDIHSKSFTGEEQDGATGKVYYGGAMFWKNPEFPSTSTITFGEDVWGEHHPNSLIQGGNYISRGRYWHTTNLVYVDEVASGGVFTDIFQPPGVVTTGTDAKGTFAEYPDANVTGKVYSGSPPGGEFVPATLAGAAYTRP